MLAGPILVFFQIVPDLYIRLILRIANDLLTFYTFSSGMKVE